MLRLPSGSCKLDISTMVIHLLELPCTGEMGELLEAIRWGTDFIMASMPNPTHYVALYGNATEDFSYFGPPEVSYKPIRQEFCRALALTVLELVLTGILCEAAIPPCTCPAGAAVQQGQAALVQWEASSLCEPHQG